MIDAIKMRAELERDEGVKSKPYSDSVTGATTIGIGRNLDAVGLSDDEIRMLYHNDLARAIQGLDKHLPWWNELSDPRRRALVNMAFNMGIGGLLSFKKMLRALKRGAYEKAAAEVLDSKYAKQVGKRAWRVATLIREGAGAHK